MTPLARTTTVWTAGSLALVIAAFALSPVPESSGTDLADLPYYSLPFGENPFAPSNIHTSDGRLLDWRAVPSSEACGTCHAREFREWAASIHSITGPDVLYEGTILANEFDSRAGGEIATERIRWCDGCHEPMSVLAGGGTPLPETGPNEALEEGAPCILCHTATAADPRAGNAALTIAASEIRRHLTPTMILAGPERHARDMQATRHDPLLATSDFCGACHTEIRPTEVAGDQPVTFASTWTEWRESDWASEDVSCQTCHMARDPAATIAALRRGDPAPGGISHRFVGNNYLLNDPRLPRDVVRGGPAPGLFTVMSAAEHEADLDTQHAMTLAMLRAAAELGITRGEPAEGQLDLTVTVRNVGAGHDLPTAATDQRYLWLELVVLDTDGKELWRQGAFNPETRMHDPEAVTWRKVLTGHDGAQDHRHILFDTASLSYTRRPIPARATDSVEISVPLPAGVTPDSLRVEATLWYRLALPDLLQNVRDHMPGLQRFDDPVPPVAMARATLDPARQEAGVQ